MNVVNNKEPSFERHITAFELEVPEDASLNKRLLLWLYVRKLDVAPGVTIDGGNGSSTTIFSPSQRDVGLIYSTPGKYIVTFDGGLEWFRLADAYYINAQGELVHMFRPSIRPLQWGCDVLSAAATYSYWNGSRYGTRGVYGEPIKWGDSMRNLYFCYGYSPNIVGTIPAWPSDMQNAECVYYNCNGLTGAWTDDAAQLMPATCAEHEDAVAGTGTTLRQLFTEDWGGTK